VSELTELVGSSSFWTSVIIAVVVGLLVLAVVQFVRRVRHNKLSALIGNMTPEEHKAKAEEYYKKAAESAYAEDVRTYLDKGDAHRHLSNSKFPKGTGRRSA
jgi:hypothetical protein